MEPRCAPHEVDLVAGSQWPELRPLFRTIDNAFVALCLAERKVRAHVEHHAYSGFRTLPGFGGRHAMLRL